MAARICRIAPEVVRRVGGAGSAPAALMSSHAVRLATALRHASDSRRRLSRSVRHWSSVTVVRCQLAFQSASAHGFASPAAQRFSSVNP